MVSKEEMIQHVLEYVSVDSTPDEQAAALVRIAAISYGHAKPYTVMLMDCDDSDWSPWIAVGRNRDEAIQHAREQWVRAQEDEDFGEDMSAIAVVKVYDGWIGMIVPETQA